MLTSIEAQRLFLQELARQAPQIVFDLFKRDDAVAWADYWGFLSQWVIDRADAALNNRSGNRAQIREMRERGISDSILAAWKAEEWRAWMAATHSPFRPGALRVDLGVFGDGEDFRYLTPDELWARVEVGLREAVAAYHKAVFEDHPYFGLYRDLTRPRELPEVLRHLGWLIARISGATDPEIAAQEDWLDADTVRSGREAYANRADLKIRIPRGRKPKSKALE